MINEAMMEIKFHFAKIGEEELKIISAGNELVAKRKKVLNEFEQNFDPEDPAFITLREAFLYRFQKHGFQPSTMAEYNEENATLDDIIKKLKKLNIQNENIARKYDGDSKFVRIHKRIKEENNNRRTQNKNYLISEFEDDVVTALSTIKNSIDQKVFDRNNILKKDDYFDGTVYSLVDNTMYELKINSEMEDCDFIKNKIVKQYLNQYHETYGV